MTRLNLKIDLETSSGFCFGVVNAIELAEKELNKSGDLYCLGQIVHNEEEVSRLESKGMITLSHNELHRAENETVLFRAHGEPNESYEKARAINARIVDATCPIVAKLQKRIKKSYDQGECVFIFGKKDHPEVIGLNGQTNNQAFVFHSIDELKKRELPESISLYSQTTMPVDDFYLAVDFLKTKVKNLEINDTICRQVSGRKEKLTAFSRRVDIVIFIGGKKSSNGKVLFSICKRNNPNSYYINSYRDIENSWFIPGMKVGLAGATSTPKWLLDETEQWLKNL